jgi:hypothetical protein
MHHHPEHPLVDSFLTSRTLHRILLPFVVSPHQEFTLVRPVDPPIPCSLEQAVATPMTPAFLPYAIAISAT